MPHLEPTQESGRAFFSRKLSGPVVMLNLLRFRPIANSAATPHPAPVSPITGAEAYRLYVEHTAPFLEESGGEVLLSGSAGHFLVGPGDERWDAVLLVRQRS